MAAAKREGEARIYPAAIVAALAAALIAASAIEELRIPVGPLLMHPLFAVVLAMIPFVAHRLHVFPSAVGRAALLFLAGYVITLAGGPGMLPQTAKILSFAAAAVVIAVSIRTRADLGLVSSAFVLGVLVISVRGIAGYAGDAGGANPLEAIANKNAFSLYALPATAVGALIALSRDVILPVRLIALGATVINTIAVFMTANRSGWLGVVVIGAALVTQRTGGKARIAALVLSLAVAGVIQKFAAAEVVESRWQQTTEGYASDTVRLKIFGAALAIGLEHPLLGISHDQLSFEIGRRLPNLAYPIQTDRGRRGALGPHNLYGYLIGGSGLLVFTAFLVLVLRVFKAATGTKVAILRVVLTVFLVRALFSEEILYAPAFAIAFGIGFAEVRIARQLGAQARHSQGIARRGVSSRSSGRTYRPSALRAAEGPSRDFSRGPV